MFSNAQNPVREKKFTPPRYSNDDQQKKDGIRPINTMTITDSGLLFEAQRARVEATLKSRVSRIRRMLQWW